MAKQQILRKDPDNKEARQLFKYLKSIGRAKEAGNAAFKSNELDSAITKYTECLSMDRTNLKFNCVIYANRAAVWLKKKEWQNAYDDASSAIELDSSYIKAYGRRIQALYGLDRYDEAVGECERALKLRKQAMQRGTSNDLKQQLRESKIELKKSKRFESQSCFQFETDSYFVLETLGKEELLQSAGSGEGCDRKGDQESVQKAGDAMASRQVCVERRGRETARRG